MCFAKHLQSMWFLGTENWSEFRCSWNELLISTKSRVLSEIHAYGLLSVRRECLCAAYLVACAYNNSRLRPWPEVRAKWTASNPHTHTHTTSLSPFDPKQGSQNPTELQMHRVRDQGRDPFSLARVSCRIFYVFQSLRPWNNSNFKSCVFARAAFLCSINSTRSKLWLVNKSSLISHWVDFGWDESIFWRLMRQLISLRALYLILS